MAILSTLKSTSLNETFRGGSKWFIFKKKKKKKRKKRKKKKKKNEIKI